jgi:hypothetical protein
MRLRLGLTVGLAAGYYLGSKAGRARYEQINRVVRRVRRTGTYEDTAGRVQEAVEAGVAKAREGVGFGRTNGSAPAAAAPAEPYPPGRRML